jgi:protein gp37
MGTETLIPWCDHTFNPWRGCEGVSSGCRFCYAKQQAKRNPKVLGEWGRHTRNTGRDRYR